MFKTLLKGSTVSKKLLTLIAIMGLGSMQVMAQTVIGGKKSDTEWYGWADQGCNIAYTLGPNKTITFDFVVNNTSKAGDWAGWMVLAKSGDVEHFFKQCVGFGVTEGNWTDESKNTVKGNWFKCNFSSVDYATWKDEVVGAHVIVTVSRVAKEVRYLVNLTAANKAERGQYFVMDNCGDGTQDMTITFGADQAEIALSSANITESAADPEVKGTLVGDIDNSSAFAARSADYAIAPESSTTICFYNYGNKAANWYNWIFEANVAGKYLDLRSDHAGWGDYWDVANLTSAYDWSTFKDDLYGAAVEIVATRTGNKLDIRATQTTTTGKVLVETYTVTNEDFATSDAIPCRMLCEGCHIDIVPTLTATTTISSYGWSTFCSPNALNFAGIEGLKAYMVTGHTDSALTLAEVTGTVPAGTPLLLNGTADQAYNISIVSSSATAVSDNLLKAGTGAAVAAEDGKTKYVLSVNDGKAEFQKINTNAATVAAGKAYLEFDEVIFAPALSLDLGTTAIKAVESRQAAEGFFNLAGQRVAQPKKGLYIVNGKKIIVK